MPADDFEHSDGVVFLAERRTADVNNVIETFELDCSIDAQIRSRAFRQCFIKGDFDGYSSLLHCGIDAFTDLSTTPLRVSIDRFLTRSEYPWPASQRS